MVRSSYQVQLEVFEGPLDLLLHLIEQQELEITTISLAQVTDQYLAYLSLVQEKRPDDMADFIATAARLLLIKSRALLPHPPKITEVEDVGKHLVRQLREYRRFKQIANTLRQRDLQGLHMYLRTIPTSKILDLAPKLDLAGTSLEDLVTGLHTLLQKESEDDDQLRVVPHRVTIGQTIERIDKLLQTQSVLTFDTLLGENHSRVGIIVTLLAVLELIRARRIAVHQDALFSTISISALANADSQQIGSPASDDAEA